MIDCLVHPAKIVRTQAIKTLIVLSDEKTPFMLVGYFAKEDFENQAHILNSLLNMATDDQKDFMIRLLDAPDNIIKVKAAAVLVNNCTNGMQVVEQRAAIEPEPFERILRHVKSVK